MKRVLITDDSLFMRKRIANILNKEGFIIVGEAENGKQAIEKSQSLHPDIITMDVTMPICDGIEAVKKILELNPKIKIVMVSAIATHFKIVEALQAGAVDFIAKPFNEHRVIECFKNL